MEDLMSDHKSQRVDVGEDIEESDKVEGVPEGELEITDIVHYLEEEEPIKGDGGIEAESEFKVVLLKILAFLLCGIPDVVGEKLIKEGKQCIGDEDDRPCMILESKGAVQQYGRKQQIRQG